MRSVEELYSDFKKGAAHMRARSEATEFFWRPDEMDPRKLHNNYVRCLCACYFSKFADLSEALIHGVDERNYLSYGLSARALIENVATLRYYVQFKYKPMFDAHDLTGTWTLDDLRELIVIDDQHLRGGRFDWESFLTMNYSKLKDDAVRGLTEKGGSKEVIKGIAGEQVNTLTCIEKWAKETPEVLIAYNLFCDLVHPNIGSSFMVASVREDRIYFSRHKGEPLGRSIFEQSLPILMSTTHKTFGEQLNLLMATCWQDDELG